MRSWNRFANDRNHDRAQQVRRTGQIEAQIRNDQIQTQPQRYVLPLIIL